MRADARRIVIVAPGSLVEQWRDEMFEKFGLEFRVFTKDLEAATPSGNPFEDIDHLIVRLDQMARNEDMQEKLCAAGWDLVVFDEAHKLAAHFFGSKLEKTGRFKLAEKLGAHTRHLLLMTATPHNGKEEDFQLFLSLLDSDRFYGKFRDGVHKVDTSDLMRRMVKEELVKFDGTPLFPERRAYTVNYKLSDIEAALYEAVTHYVKTEMGKADQLGGQRKGSVGFALTSLQRRLASSPEAIYQSLKRRRERLQRRLREENIANRGGQILAETLAPAPPPSAFAGDGLAAGQELPEVPDDDDDLTANEQEQLEESLVDQATTAKTIAELEDEIDTLIRLENQAREVVASGQDRKWEELSRILQRDEHMHDAGGRLLLVSNNGPTGTVVSVAHKRWSQCESGQIVIEELRATAPFRPDGATAETAQFLARLAVGSLPQGDLFALYQSWLDSVLALEAAQITGAFVPPPSVERSAALRENLDARAATLRDLVLLRAQAENETQLNRRVELNLAIKKLDARIAELDANL